MFYIYEWFNIETKEIFYVGKGCGNRYKQTRKRNRLFAKYYNNNNCDVRIIKYFEQEEDAFKYENKRILELKNIGQCFCNLDNGGKGGVNFIWTDEMRKYQSEFNPMKDAKQRERMSKNNPMKNPEIARKTNSKKMIPIIIGNEEFESIKQACDKYGTIVYYWLEIGRTKDLKPCYRKEDGIKTFKKNKRSGKSVPIIYKGELYECQIDACKKFNISPSLMNTFVKRGYDDDNEECRKITDKPIKEYYPNNGNKTPIILEGVRYESIQKAHELTGINPITIRKALKENKLCKGLKCEYANQQPILVKSTYKSNK